jgi:isopenicillin-N N-acyltransferase-like protein
VSTDVKFKSKGEKMKDFFPIIELAGDNYDMGVIHGKALAKAIKANLSLYYDMVKGLTGLEPDTCLVHADKYIDILDAQTPQLLEEMKGIAEGAEVSLKEILFLNARSELISMGSESYSGLGECTTLGLSSRRTGSGNPAIAQNWDWHKRVRDTTAIFKIRPADGPQAVFYAEAGQVGKIGFNENGVGVIFNFLTTGEVSYGLPVHVLLRMILNTKSAAEAVSMVTNAPRGGTAHFLIGDLSGHMRGLELTPSDAIEIKPESGVVYHTNHYCDPNLAQKDAGRLLMVDTTARYDRAAELISQRTHWDNDSLREIFSDHDNHPASICRHVKESDPEFLHMVTVASIIIDLAAKKMFISCGQPCKSAYREVVLNSN